ncbi:MAG TPA: hypothetical protein VNU48_03970 [Burkholderiaceae bacterium]|nr:hypothetical protein [Burkholderiaceae bacterium]
MIAQVVRTRQPDAAVEHRQLAAQRPQTRGIGMELEGSAMKQLELRIHHQSPALGVAMIGHCAFGIQ